MDGRAERGERGVREGIKRPSPSATVLTERDMPFDLDGALAENLERWVSDARARHAGRLARLVPDPARCPCGARAADHE